MWYSDSEDNFWPEESVPWQKGNTDSSSGRSPLSTGNIRTAFPSRSVARKQPKKPVERAIRDSSKVRSPTLNAPTVPPGGSESSSTVKQGPVSAVSRFERNLRAAPSSSTARRVPPAEPRNVEASSCCRMTSYGPLWIAHRLPPPPQISKDNAKMQCYSLIGNATAGTPKKGSVVTADKSQSIIQNQKPTISPLVREPSSEDELWASFGESSGYEVESMLVDSDCETPGLSSTATSRATSLDSLVLTTPPLTTPRKRARESVDSLGSTGDVEVRTPFAKSQRTSSFSSPRGSSPSTATSLASDRLQMLTEVISSTLGTSTTASTDNTTPPSTSQPSFCKFKQTSSQPPEQPIIIAHDNRVQGLMDKYNLSWGTQYEIARGVCDGRWTWDEITSGMIQALQGSNADAVPKVSVVIKGIQQISDVKIWAEPDREQAAITENEARGLGLMGDWDDVTNWYGGRLQQRARVTIPTDASPDTPFRLTLEKIEMKKSHFFGRKLGSRHLLQFKLLDKVEDATDFMSQKFVLCGRIFVAFGIKDGTVHLIETNENYGRKSSVAQGDHYRMAFMDFINWFNPMHLNGSKTLSKWVARFDLGLSTSLPVVRFAPEHIAIIPDEHPSNAPRPIPTEQVLTDGCGYMNKAALAAIGKQIGAKDGVPTAVQGRIFGSKGLWTLHPTNTLLSAPPRIWIRDSQLEVNLVTDYTPALLSQLDKAHFVFILVAPAHVSTPIQLNKDAIINLAHNGVPKDVIVKLMKDSLEEELAPYVQALGLTGRLPESDDETGESKVLSSISTASSSSSTTQLSSVSAVSVSSIASSSSSTSWERPETVHDEIMALIQAGFDPLQCRTLYESLRQLITNVMRKFISEYHINVQKSADAFLIPDPWNVLKPGQIFFKSSKLLKDSLEDDNPNYILEDVLLYRNPCRLPSDIQKVTAVKEPLLEFYVDVIVLSIQGDSSAANYDGDTGICIFDEVLVQSFTNSQLCTPPANFEEVNFESKDRIPTVKVFYQQTSSFTPHDIQVNLQQYLLAPVKQMQIGLYSKFHDVVTYAWGYDNPESIRTAFI
ncbi:RNA dependent RNA polymerase-domain-containing protein [Abortiporus biennis]|nr:RNA dependent RNA polymerase-domain-containing protein [Abortiporus biennis]